MRKTINIFIAHTIRFLRNILFFFIIMFISLFVWLKVGIEVDQFVLGKFKVERLYIKLDKKLTLMTENMIIHKSNTHSYFDNFNQKSKKIFDQIKYFLSFFHKIEVKKILYERDSFHLLFLEDKISIKSDEYEVVGNIYRKKQQLVAEISMLHLKKEDIHIIGKLFYDFNTDILHAKGNFDAYNIKGDFVANKEENTIDFKLNTNLFTDLKTLINQLSLNRSIKSWIIDKVQAQKYKIQRLEGQVMLTQDGLKIDFDTLKGDVLFDDVKIYYQEKLNPVLAKSFTLRYEDKVLYFDLKKPTYKKRDMDGSKIAITNLGKKKTILKLDLHMFTPIDAVIQEILKSYALDIPVEYKGENSYVNFKMDIPLGEASKKNKSTIFVNIDLKKGELFYKKIKLPLVGGNVKFDNKKNGILANLKLSKGIVFLGETKLPIIGGDVQYENDVVTLQDVHLKEKWYEGKVEGEINIKEQKADLIFNVKHISIGDKKKFFVLKKRLLPLIINYNKSVDVELPSLDLKFINKSKEFLIEIGELKKIKPYLNNIGIDVDGGTLKIKTKDFKSYTFEGELRRKACFFYEKNGVCESRVPCNGTATPEGLDFYSFDKRLHFSSIKSRIKLKNLNIDLKKFLKSRKKTKKGKVDNRKLGNSSKLIIIGKNSQLRYGEHILVTDSYDIEIEKNGDIKAIGSLEGDIVKFSKKKKQFSIEALRVKDKLLHSLIQFTGLKKGRYSLKYHGNPEKEIKGQIIVEGGIMNDFIAYNNTLAFLNTIPAIATLNSPGFSEKGFKINEGLIEYHMVGDTIFLDSVYIRGQSATIVGKGNINIKTKMIQMDLAIQTARELGKLIGKLPLVGYILMGKDKSMTIGLKITGTFDKPIVQTSATAEILSLPLEIIKRTIESPAYIINQ